MKMNIFHGEKVLRRRLATKDGVATEIANWQLTTAGRSVCDDELRRCGRRPERSQTHPPMYIHAVRSIRNHTG